MNGRISQDLASEIESSQPCGSFPLDLNRTKSQRKILFLDGSRALNESRHDMKGLVSAFRDLFNLAV
jgi:hypothetical protein